MSGTFPEVQIVEPQAHGGASARFEKRWHLVGMGLSNVWRFGNLELPASTGRLLLRGPNGTGKTTALEAFWPYLLDLDRNRLSAGKARSTTLSSLMREGVTAKRRCGYAWLTWKHPGEGLWSFGVRLQFSEGSTPQVRVIPFTAPGRPLHELPLYGAGRSALTAEEFKESVTARGGQAFDSEESYVAHLTARVFATPAGDALPTLATRLRQVRNPALLGDLSADKAADALRESLPGVAEDVIEATAEALAESKATREAFERDREAADLLDDFRSVWSAHATEVVRATYARAVEALKNVRAQEKAVGAAAEKLESAEKAATAGNQRFDGLETTQRETLAELKALEGHQAYRDAGTLAELQKRLRAEQSNASARVGAMCETASSIASQSRSLRRELNGLIEDIEHQTSEAARVDARAVPAEPPLRCSEQPVLLLSVVEATADPGARLVIHGDAEGIRAVVASWESLADEHRRSAGTAALALIDHKPVADLQEKSDKTTKLATEAAQKADAESAKAQRATVEARDAATDLLSATLRWSESNPRITGSSQSVEDEAGGARETSWEASDISELSVAEPGQVLATVDGWARIALARAERIAANLRSRAREAAKEAERLQHEREQLLEEARDLRAGRLLPLPRPAWAGDGNDDVAIGAVLDWATGFDDGGERALIESVLAASGFLGASTGEDAVVTTSWRVDVHGAEVSPNLAEVVAVDPDHPLASIALDVLTRVALQPSAIASVSEKAPTALVIGRDGTFRAGVLTGRVPGADDPALLTPASHVGSRQRRAAALARAEELEQRADELERIANAHVSDAKRLEIDSSRFSTAGRSFPPRQALQDAEARRSAAASNAMNARRDAEELHERAERLRQEVRELTAEWGDRTRGRGLPADVDRLKQLRDQGEEIGNRLGRAAVLLDGKAQRLEPMIADLRKVESQRSGKLVEAEAEARIASDAAASTQVELRTLEATAGAAIAEILSRHARAEKRLAELTPVLKIAGDEKIAGARAETEAQLALRNAGEKLEEARPQAVVRQRELRTLVEFPGVADAVLDGALIPADADLITQLGNMIEGRKPVAKKTVRDRVDQARPKLAGIWSIEAGDDHGELLTYVLAHQNNVYTPTQAAAHAIMLKQRAEQALAASEEAALREFIIGRLPSAIGTAWVRLQDWIDEVNQKMRGAAASSGVGVQVSAPRRKALSPAVETVFELSCRVSDAERTEAQQRQLAEALQSLLRAASGETMLERVNAVVDIREWVEVHYEVTRPGGRTQRWGPKTGLSGGERRLVVLAPMLAAVSAAYDRLGDQVPRLVGLDEVPAEVDERGREGLARYIAALDLDLVCTSHLWDGCPGAWDGIDAYDLEAGPDGTVVGFPMLVRGLLPIPGEAPDALPSDDRDRP